MGMRINYGVSKRGFKFQGTILLLITFLPFACAVENSQQQQSAIEAEGTLQESTADTSAPYSVECGQVNDAGEPFCYVDRGTYVGWRTFHASCLRCHGQNAVGSTFAPSLLDRMQQSDMTRDLFVDRLANGFTGQVGVMPPWKDNPNVSKRYGELYAYLTARASGALPPGRPKPKPKSN